MNRKAGLTDGLFLVVALFAIALIFLFVFVVVFNVNAAFQSGNIISAQGKSMAQDLTNRYASIFDGAFLFITMGTALGMIAGAFFISSHPAIFWISIPLLFFNVWLGGFYSNIYSEFSSNGQIATLAAYFPITTFIFNNFVILIMVFVLLLGLALFAKPRFEQ